jgi:hypothetical protein
MKVSLLRGLVALGTIGVACSVVNAPDAPKEDDDGAGAGPATGAGGVGGGDACSGSLIECGGQCVDTQTSLAHCGDCHSPCDAGETCVLGSCTTGCAPPLIACGASCVDPATDPAHCGGCDTPCDANQVCAGSDCVPCVAPTEPCDNVCVDTTSDEAHCGGCGVACDPGEICAAGNCVLCGDGILQPGEEVDPPPGPSANVPVNPVTCRYDFSAITQLYCAGTCGNWGGGNDCDQGDADAFCKLKMDNPNSTATTFSATATAAAPGICCPPPTVGPGGLGCTDLGVLSSRGVLINVGIDEVNMSASHGGGTVVTNVVCTNP